MNLLLDIIDIMLAAWPVCCLFALFLLARLIYKWWCLRRYAAYVKRMRDEWNEQGFDAWLDLWEAQEQEQEK